MLDKTHTYELKECFNPECTEIVPPESASGKPRTKTVYDKRKYHSHSCSQLHTKAIQREKAKNRVSKISVMNSFLY